MTAWALAAAMAVLLQSAAAQPPRFQAGQLDERPGTRAPEDPRTRGQAAYATGRFQIGGSASLPFDALPRMETIELRPQAAVDVTMRLGGPWRAKFDGFAEALLSNRSGSATDAILRAREAWIEVAGKRGDLRAGYGRLVWGRLDEIQPSDVINPIDASRFLFDGRSAARLAVAFVRGRVFVSEDVVIEGVLAPVFRRGTFDELAEDTSPFNLTNDLVLPAGVFVSSEFGVDRREPATNWSNVSGGGRVSATIGRVDFAAGAYRGWEGFGTLSFEPFSLPASVPFVVGRLVEQFPRFTMVSADFETVIGDWALRGEAAAFVEKTFQGQSVAGPVKGRAIDAGIGFDLGTDLVRVFGSVVFHRQWSDADPAIDRTDVTLIGSIERSFGRERYLARVFGATTPNDRSGFLRGLFTWTMRDNVTLDLSAAIFVGEGETTLGQFHGRDFLLTRLRYHW